MLVCTDWGRDTVLLTFVGDPVLDMFPEVERKLNDDYVYITNTVQKGQNHPEPTVRPKECPEPWWMRRQGQRRPFLIQSIKSFPVISLIGVLAVSGTG